MSYQLSVTPPPAQALALRALPEVLPLQLRRFDIDWNTMQRVKVSTARQQREPPPPPPPPPSRRRHRARRTPHAATARA